MDTPAESLADFIARLVVAAPPITPEQHAVLAVQLHEITT
jgi:hypothetical protein